MDASSSNLKKGPYGCDGELVQELSSSHVIDMYRKKCGVDVSPWFDSVDVIGLYRCVITGAKYWRPTEVAGDEAFYRLISTVWGSYYREDRWEYAVAQKWLEAEAGNLIEVGCGRGFFLKLMEAKNLCAMGLELNAEAIANKVTKNKILNNTLESYAATAKSDLDVICSFQVFEHLTEPGNFMAVCNELIRAGGSLIISVPNNHYTKHYKLQDAFDLPPHHVNQFTISSLEKIGKLYGLELKQVAVKSKNFRFPLILRFYRKCMEILESSLGSVRFSKLICYFPFLIGHTIVVKFVKK